MAPRSGASPVVVGGCLARSRRQSIENARSASGLVTVPTVGGVAIESVGDVFSGAVPYDPL